MFYIFRDKNERKIIKMINYIKIEFKYTWLLN